MNKPTHILIPIEDINILKMLVAAIDLRSDNAPAIKKFINQFQNDFPRYKQISLNEEDIEEKALNAIRKTTMVIAGRTYKVSDIQLGYEQALKDLL